MLRIRELRDRKGWSLKDLSHHSGISRQQLWRYETGQSSPSVEIAFAIARALGVSLDKLHRPDPAPLPEGRGENAAAPELVAAGSERD